MRKPTHADRVFEHLKEHGEITNVHATLQMGIWRLAAVMHGLKKEGRIIIDEAASGFIGESRNYRYVARPAGGVLGYARPVDEQIEKPVVTITQPTENHQAQPQVMKSECKNKDCLCHKAKGMKTKIKHLSCLFCGCSRMIMPGQ